MALRARTLAAAALALALAGAATAQELDDFGDFVDSGYGVRAGEILQSSLVVDSPTATVLPHGHYRIRGRLMDGGSLVAATGVGIKDRFEVGVSWGMQGLLGRGEVEFNDRTALALRLLLVREMQFPSLLIGFDSQGYGAWDAELERYERKSKGFYACLTRNWYGPLGTDVATTAGINYSTEDKDESSVDFFFGFEQDFDRQFALLLDYSAGLDDREQESPRQRYGSGKGWLDLGLRWNVVGPVQFKFFFRDLLSNLRHPATGDIEPVDRQFEISYEGSF